ncbi:MAG: DUF362 domain-containing protein, partial [Clostridia bacterium]|nr:DUF362 domain-containing protein [Clostridia bacterium]
MGKAKSIIIYSVIIVLCAVAFGGYLMNRSPKKADAPQASTKTEQQSTSVEQQNTNTEKKAEETAAKPAENQVKELDPAQFKSDVERKHVEEIMKKAFEAPEPNPVVGVGTGTDFEKVTEKAIENAGGLQNIIKKGQVVLIKPNLCYMPEAGSPLTTDYRVVKKVAELALKHGASKVIIAEGNFSSDAFQPALLEMSKYDTIKGVELVNLNSFEKKDCYELQPKESLVGKAIFVPKVFMDADVVINVAKLKTHFLTAASMSLKNCIGVPSFKVYPGGGSKDALHGLGIENVIIDLNRIRKPEFSVIDGIVGGEGNGPMNNTPVKSNIVLAGKDMVALDTAGLTFMGFKLEEVNHVKLAADKNMGIADLKSIKINGADINAIKMDFESPF